MWWDSLFQAYKNAYEKFQKYHPGATLRLWELDLSIDEETLEMAAKHIVREILCRGIAENPRASALFLRYVLRRHLSRIRGNYLWPEVGRFLTQMSSEPLQQPRLQRYFRESLLHMHGDELSNRHNKYVVFLIEDTGAGLARSDLVKNFLLQMVSEYERLWGKKSPREYLAEVLEDIEQDNELAVLSGVLESTARTLLEMVDFHHAHRIPKEVKENWNTARDFWNQAIGQDINRLIPEAQETLGDVVAYVNHRTAQATHRQSNTIPSIRLLLHDKPIRAGVVVVHYSSERLEAVALGQVPMASAGVSINTWKVDGVSRYFLRGWPVDRPAWVRVGSVEWTVINVSGINVMIPHTSVRWGDLRVVGHHCVVMQAQQSTDIQVSYADAFDGNIFLRVSSYGNATIIPVTKSQPVHINEWLSGTGPFSLEVLFDETSLGLDLQAYLFDSPPQKLPTNLGRKASLDWEEQGDRISVFSVDPIEILTVVEKKYVLGRYSPNEEWALEFQWKPLVRDVFMKCDGKRVIVDETAPLWAGEILHSVSLEMMGEISDIEVFIDSMQCPHLSQFQSLLSSVLHHADDAVSIKIQAKNWTKTWIVTQGVGALQTTVEWDKEDIPTARIEWTSIRPEAPTVCILGNQGTCEAIEDMGLTGPLGFHRFCTTMRWILEPNKLLLNEAIPVNAMVRGQWTQVALLSPPPLNDANQIRLAIDALLNTTTDPQDAWNIVYLNERYLRKTGKLVFTVDKQARILSQKNYGVSDAIYTLKLLAQLVKGQASSRHTVDAVAGIDAYSRVFYLSLLVINQQQLFRKGLGNRQVCQDLMDNLQKHFGDGKVGNWCRVMVQYCSRQINGANSHTDIANPFPSDPIVLYDPVLRDWLDQIYR